MRSATTAGIIVALLFGLIEGGPGAAGGQDTNPPAVSPASDTYVGSLECARCHSAIFKTFSQTGMGRSMQPITRDTVGVLKLPWEMYDAKLDRHFAVFAKGDNVYQSEFQTSPDGTEVFRETQQLKWKIGAGENGFGAITETEHTLFQAPLSYYTRAGEWGLSPGYEFGDYGFNRPILAGCASCHSGRPRPVANANGRFDEPAFFQLTIGC